MKRTVGFILIIATSILLLASCNSSSSSIQIPKDTFEADENAPETIKLAPVTLADMPEADNNAELYAEINGNIPFFEEDELSTVSWQYYSDLDDFRRPQTAMACLGKDLLPEETSGYYEDDIIRDYNVRPVGWHDINANAIEGWQLYYCSYLIAYDLTGQQEYNPKNYIVLTRTADKDSLPIFENMIKDYIEGTENHVMYRITPMYDNENLLTNGVLVEAYSVEDNGEGISFCVFCYNHELGATIDYATGDADIVMFADDTA